MVNVDYCKLLVHIFSKSGYCGKQIMHPDVKNLEEHCFTDTRDYFAYCRR